MRAHAIVVAVIGNEVSKCLDREFYKMAFEAIDTKTGEYVKLYGMELDEINALKIAIEEGRETLTCCDKTCHCEQRIKAADSDQITTHFFTLNSDRVNTDSWAHIPSGENKRHKLAKVAIARYLTKHSDGAVIHTEHEKVFENGKRGDVVAFYEDGSFIVHEAQYNRQTADILKKRTDDRIAAGAKAVVWWWGETARRTTSHVFWCVDNCDQYGELSPIYTTIAGMQKQTGVNAELFDSLPERQARERRRQRIEAEQKARAEQYRKTEADRLQREIEYQKRQAGIRQQQRTLLEKRREQNAQVQAQQRAKKQREEDDRAKWQRNLLEANRNNRPRVGDVCKTRLGRIEGSTTITETNHPLYRTTSGLLWEWTGTHLVMPNVEEDELSIIAEKYGLPKLKIETKSPLYYGLRPVTEMERE